MGRVWEIMVRLVGGRKLELYLGGGRDEGGWGRMLGDVLFGG